MNRNLLIETRDNVYLSLTVNSENVDVVTRAVEKSTILELVKSIKNDKLFGIATIENDKDVVKMMQKKARFSTLKEVVSGLGIGLFGMSLIGPMFNKEYSNTLRGAADALGDSRKCMRAIRALALSFASISTLAIVTFPEFIPVIYPALYVFMGLPGPFIGLFIVELSKRR